MAQERISIAELLAYVSDELRELQQAAAKTGNTPFMRFQECELELAVEAEKSVNGELKVYLLKLGGSAKKAESHTIKVKMTALTGPPESHQLVAYGESTAGAESRVGDTQKQKKNRKGKKVR
jgi:Trypsin-co-occurring domain 2